MDISASISSLAVNIIVILGSILLLLVVAVIVYFVYWKNKQYDTLAIIIKRLPNGATTWRTTRAGMIRNPFSKKTEFRLKGGNVPLDTKDIPFTPGKKIVFLEQKDVKSYVFMDYEIAKKEIKLTCTQEDLSWAINSYGDFVRTFKNNTLREVLSFALVALAVVTVIILIAMLIKKFDVLLTISETLKETAIALRAGGTTIVGG